jgi:L-methionine (R)-S-oxide reductase
VAKLDLQTFSDSITKPQPPAGLSSALTSITRKAINRTQNIGIAAAASHRQRDAIANAANTAALLLTSLPDLNWAGFYFLRSPNELVLGPFQGRPACVRIAVGRGVCGTAVERRRSMLVEDVHAFADHIACDAASRSELVVPLIRDRRILGVIDLDNVVKETGETIDYRDPRVKPSPDRDSIDRAASEVARSAAAHAAARRENAQAGSPSQGEAAEGQRNW